MNKINTPLYNIVFNGYFVSGKDPVEVKKTFAKKFGSDKAKAVFANSSIVLKRKATKEQAEKFQKILQDIGLKIDLEAVISSSSNLSLKEDLGQIKQQTIKSDSDESPVIQAAVKKKPPTKVYSTAELDAAFIDEVKPKAPSTLYLLALIPVTLLMLLLPLIYLSITAFSAYCVFWLITSGFDYVFIGIPSRMFIRILSYGGLVIGSILITIFLAKPFISRSPSLRQPVRLDPQREKTLFHLVKRITDVVGSPMPSEILVDSRVNASASLSKGVFSKNLTLTIGLPLLYGMNVQTVSGILAHEFGHFTQRIGMRSTYIVGSINYWFYSKTHEHDNWDDWVDELMDSEYGFLQAGAHIARFGSYVCKYILIALEILARLISLSLIRQMEYDADRYQTALLGSTQYRKTAIRLRELSSAYQLIIKDINHALDGGKLVDNVPKFITFKANEFTDTQRLQLANTIQEINTSVFDTHPSDQARIKSAIDADIEAKFVHKGAAEFLLRDLERYSQLCTLQWYRSFGFNVSIDDLTPFENIKQDTDKQAQTLNAAKKYFGKLEGFSNYLNLTEDKASENSEEPAIELDKLEFIKTAKKELTKDTPKYFEARKILFSLYKKRDKYDRALYWLNQGETLDNKSFMLTHGTKEEVHSLLENLDVHIQKELDILKHCTNLQSKRLNTGLELAVEAKPELSPEVKMLKRAYVSLSKTDSITKSLLTANNSLADQISHEEENSGNHFTSRAINTAIGESNRYQTGLLRALEKTRDPFNPNQTINVSLSQQKNLDGNNADYTLQEGQRLIRQLRRLINKIEGRMAELALQVEDKIFTN